MKYLFYLFTCFLLACNTNSKPDTKIIAATPFWNDIQNFKKQDSIHFPPKNAILFIGSSSFTKWTDVQDYFPGYTIINRGFGGSTLLDQIRYVNDIVFPYQPKQIIIYCGENDLASSDTITAEIVVDRFKQLYKMIREKTDAPIAFISIKPSPSRRHLFAKMRLANLSIMDFSAKQDSMALLRSNMDPTPLRFIDVYWKMLNKAGEPMPEIFLEDNLDMNAKGYDIWQKEIQPYLLKD